jgi:hypothetical protein
MTSMAETITRLNSKISMMIWQSINSTSKSKPNILKSMSSISNESSRKCQTSRTNQIGSEKYSKICFKNLRRK